MPNVELVCIDTPNPDNKKSKIKMCATAVTCRTYALMLIVPFFGNLATFIEIIMMVAIVLYGRTLYMKQSLSFAW